MKNIMKNIMKDIDWKSSVRSIRETLWRLSLIGSCPWCGNGLEKIGHSKDAGWQYYRCTNSNCTFGK